MTYKMKGFSGFGSSPIKQGDMFGSNKSIAYTKPGTDSLFVDGKFNQVLGPDNYPKKGAVSKVAKKAFNYLKKKVKKTK